MLKLFLCLGYCKYVAMSMGVQITFELVFLFPLDIVLGVELLDYIAVLSF